MIRFGHDWDPECMVMDETLYATQAKVQNFAVMYLGESCPFLSFMGGQDSEIANICGE